MIAHNNNNTNTNNSISEPTNNISLTTDIDIDMEDPELCMEQQSLLYPSDKHARISISDDDDDQSKDKSAKLKFRMLSCSSYRGRRRLVVLAVAIAVTLAVVVVWGPLSSSSSSSLTISVEDHPQDTQGTSHQSKSFRSSMVKGENDYENKSRLRSLRRDYVRMCIFEFMRVCRTDETVSFSSIVRERALYTMTPRTDVR